MALTGQGFTAGNSDVVDENRKMTQQFRSFLIFVTRGLLQSVVSGWATPTGTGSRAAIDANWTTVVSNPPTQAEVTAVRNQLIAVQKALAQLIIDQESAGTIS